MANKTFQGRRVYLQEGQTYLPLQIGDYGKDVYGRWHVRVPSGDGGMLTEHAVIEHEDKTITVSPSILLEGGMHGGWHGYLEHGVFREV